MEELTSFRIFEDLVRDDKKAVSWTSSYSCNTNDSLVRSGSKTLHGAYGIELVTESFILGRRQGSNEG
jgi:hypothetical protein